MLDCAVITYDVLLILAAFLLVFAIGLGLGLLARGS
jgi:hypothetical protein